MEAVRTGVISKGDDVVSAHEPKRASLSSAFLCVYAA